MGAEQSSAARESAGAQGPAPAPSRTKACYYDLLSIDRQASDEEIKKAYRRKALELHPDRNYGDAEKTTKQFAEVQSAYEVLSDPQERAWYDSHREAILRHDDLGEEHSEHNIRLTSASDIIALMSDFTKRVPFSNAPNGFYGRLRTMFETLAKEEDAASKWAALESVQYPDFGGAEDMYEEIVRPFYATWMGFSTRKAFSWLDIYNFAEAPDRRIRRLMEKENKRLRDDGIKEFNDAVRSLVAFVRKRDPRFTPNDQSEADRQKVLRGAAAAQAARSRAANQAKLDELSVSDWMKARETEVEPPSDSSLDPSDDEHFECVTCRKVFKSEKQYETHEKSKKHIKAVQLLKREMEKENKLLKLESDVIRNGGSPPGSMSNEEPSLSPPRQKSCPDRALSSDQTSNANRKSISSSTPQTEKPETKITSATIDSGHTMRLGVATEDLPTSDGDLDQDYASEEELEARIFGLAVANDPHLIHHDQVHRDASEKAVSVPDTSSVARNRASDGEQGRKLGKAKAKRAKKAARIESSDLGDTTCSTCNQTFDSKTKLFRHVKELDHARPFERLRKNGGGKER